MDGTIAAERLSAIARQSSGEPGVTRLPFTSQHRAALSEITGWMEDAGLSVAMDAAGTLVGRSPGPADRPALLIGSHQDSVPSGGAFDGIMGIALGCLAARRFRDRWHELPFAIEVLAFADEEGVRFPTALMGPRALAGTVDASILTMADADGTTLGDAMAAFGADPGGLAALARRPGDCRGYLELHIEQGPVLEREDRAVGVVTAICGIARYAVVIGGETGHAGTVPMAGRRDALAGAARMIAAVEDHALGVADLRATVGRLSVRPGAVNAIPAQVEMTLEIRAAHDDVRDGFAAEAERMMAAIAAERNLSLGMDRTYAQKAVQCDPALSDALAAAISAGGEEPLSLMSGATHDASAMSDLCPVAMLFVRCRDGVSHRPDEYATAADMGRAVDTVAAAIEHLARTATAQA